MTLSDLLESTITEPPPHFRGIDGLIARERRRSRARRAGAAFAGAAVVLAVLLGVQSLLGTSAAPPVTPPQATPTQTATVDRYTRLTALLMARLSAMVPDAVVNSNDTTTGTTGGRFIRDDGSTATYDIARAAFTFRSRTAGTLLEMGIGTPATPADVPTGGMFDLVYGGCAAQTATDPALSEFADSECSTVNQTDGSTYVYGWKRYGNWLYHYANIVYLDRTAVTVSAASSWPAGPALSIDQVVSLATDRGFVNDPGPLPSPEGPIVTATGPANNYVLPPNPQIGTVYAYDLYTHCGVDLAAFAGATWRADPPDDGRLPGAFIRGTLQLLDADTAIFVIDQTAIQTERKEIVYHRTEETMPPCQ